MHDIMIITPIEWVLLTIASVALIHVAVTCLNMRNALIRAEQRTAFPGLAASLSAASKRSTHKSGDS